MKEREGKRYYGCWAGNPEGRAEDPKLCIESVWSKDRFSQESQCSRKRGHGPNGLYCKIHDPAAVKAREEKSNAKYEEGLEKHRLGWDGPTMLKALIDIANGHNDARSLASETITKLDRDIKTGKRLKNDD